MSATLTHPLLPPPADNGDPTTNSSDGIEARLICIFDRAYGIQNNQDLQTEVAKLIYLRHVKQVFVDSNTTTTSTNFITKHVGTKPELAGAAKYTFGQIVTGKGLIIQYLANPDPAIKNAIKLYVAPEYRSLKTILRNSTGSSDLNQPNSVYILCPLGVIKQLIIVLQKMGFNKNYFRNGIYIQSNQLNSILANSIKKLIPDSKNLYGGSGSSNGSNSSDESMISFGPSLPTGRLRADSGLTSTIPQRPDQPISMTISSLPGTTSLGTQLTLLTPDTNSPTTSNQALSILNFLSIKPDTKSKFENMARVYVYNKIPAGDHDDEIKSKILSMLPDMNKQNVKAALQRDKEKLNLYELLLSKFNKKFNELENMYKSGEYALAKSLITMGAIKNIDEYTNQQKLVYFKFNTTEKTQYLDTKVLVDNLRKELQDSDANIINTEETIAKYEELIKSIESLSKPHRDMKKTIDTKIDKFIKQYTQIQITTDPDPDNILQEQIQQIDSLLKTESVLRKFLLALKYMSTYVYYTKAIKHYEKKINDTKYKIQQYESNLGVWFKTVKKPVNVGSRNTNLNTDVQEVTKPAMHADNQQLLQRKIEELENVKGANYTRKNWFLRKGKALINKEYAKKVAANNALRKLDKIKPNPPRPAPF